MEDVKFDELGFRYKALDPDFRRDPKTSVFCALCQKDIKDAPKHYAHFVGGGFAAVLVEDREIANERLSEADNYGILPVGPECARKIGRGFLYSAEEAEKLRRS